MEGGGGAPALPQNLQARASGLQWELTDLFFLHHLAAARQVLGTGRNGEPNRPPRGAGTEGPRRAWPSSSPPLPAPPLLVQVSALGPGDWDVPLGCKALGSIPHTTHPGRSGRGYYHNRGVRKWRWDRKMTAGGPRRAHHPPYLGLGQCQPREQTLIFCLLFQKARPRAQGCDWARVRALQAASPGPGATM